MMNQRNFLGDDSPSPSSPNQTAGRREGQRRKEEAHNVLEASRAAILRLARRELLSKLLTDGRATADDVRNMIELPDDMNPVALGAAPGLLAKAGIIERDGYRNSQRPTAHARPVSIWRLKDEPKARAWLRANPPWPIDSPDAPPQEKSPAAATAEPCASDPQDQLNGDTSDE